MSIISLRLPDELVEEIDRISKKLKLPRTQYIRRAIETMNQDLQAAQRRARLMKASQKVKKSSLAVNAEFDEIDEFTT